MSFKEKLFYKERPYIYAVLGLLAFSFAKKSKLAFFCGFVLIICSYVVFEMRKRHRERQEQIKNINKALSKNSHNNAANKIEIKNR